ncbi:hypothetical protein SCOR_20830 [Sulfidibacter corallicola]
MFEEFFVVPPLQGWGPGTPGNQGCVAYGSLTLRCNV